MSVLSASRARRHPDRAVSESEPRARVQPLLAAAGWVAVAVGLVLRLYDAGSKSLWSDEVSSIATSSHSWPGVVQAVLEPGNYFPPLFPFAYKLWMLGGTSDWWLRLGPALLGVGVVALTWVAGHRLFGGPAALIATALCALSTYEIYYAQYIRMYVMLAFLALLSLIFVVRAVDTNRWVWWALWALSALACMYTFYYAMFLLIGEGIWLLALALRRRELRIPVIVWSGLAVLLFLPWAPLMLGQYSHTGQRAWMGRPTLHTLRDLYNQFAFDPVIGQQTWGAELTYVIGALLIIPFILGLILPGQGKERALLLLALVCSVLLPLGISRVTQPVYDPRYEVFAAPIVYLVIGRGCGRTFDLLCTRLRAGARTRAYSLLLTAALVVIAAGAYHPLRQLYDNPKYSQADLRDAMDLILRDRKPGDVVVNGDHSAFETALWYAHHDGPPGPYALHHAYPSVLEGMPDSWGENMPVMQVLIGPPFPDTASWMPRGSGRLWLLSTTDFRNHESPTRVDPWFYPNRAQWTMAREYIFQGVVLRLYVRK